MKVKLSKQARKYLDKVDQVTYRKLEKAIDQLSRFEGDIVKLSGHENRYRYKIPHYRILFEWAKGSLIIYVIEINTRTNIKY